MSPTSHVEPYNERPWWETGYCEMRLVWLLSDMGIPRRQVLVMSQQQAIATLGAVTRDRFVDGCVREAVRRV